MQPAVLITAVTRNYGGESLRRASLARTAEGGCPHVACGLPNLGALEVIFPRRNAVQSANRIVPGFNRNSRYWSRKNRWQWESPDRTGL